MGSLRFVHFLDKPFGQLFDLMNDSDETHNLWDDPAHDARIRRLLDARRIWRIRSQYTTVGSRR